MHEHDLIWCSNPEIKELNMADAAQDSTHEKPEVVHVDPNVEVGAHERKGVISASRTPSPGFAQLVKNKRVLGYCKSDGHS